MPKEMWFKRRRYGWGWTPITWQGWATVLVFVAVVLWHPFPLSILLAIIGLLIVGFAKGPKPKWQWGNDFK